MKSLKFLMFPDQIDDKLIVKGDSPNSSIKTGYYFVSKSEKGLMSTKAHITNPAMNMIRKWCVDRYGADKARIVFIEMFKLFEHLKLNRTALLSMYFPTTMLSFKVRKHIENKLTKKENDKRNIDNSEQL